MSVSKPRRAWWILTASGLLCLLTAYLLSYFLMTRNGAYVYWTTGLGGPDWYRWEPAGFAGVDGRRRSFVVLVYCPLYLIDREWWHVDKSSSSSGVRPERRLPP